MTRGKSYTPEQIYMVALELYRVKNRLKETEMTVQMVEGEVTHSDIEVSDNKYPTTREIATIVGCTGETVRRRMKEMEEVGIIETVTDGMKRYKPCSTDASVTFKKLDNLE